MTNDIEKINVVQANELIQQANWTLDKVPLKMFKYLVACVDVMNPPKDNRICVSKMDLDAFIQSDERSHGNMVYLKKRIRQMITAVKISEDDKTEKYVALVNKIEWEKDTDNVYVTFDSEVMKYLLVNKRFLSYPASILPYLHSKYGLIIFENLLSRKRQFNKDEYILSVDDIRYITNTEKLYKPFPNFEARVIQTSINDINQANLEFLVKYEKIKVGRKIKDIKFLMTPRTTCKERSYDEALLNKISLEEKRHKEADEQFDLHDLGKFREAVGLPSERRYLDPPEDQMSLFEEQCDLRSAKEKKYDPDDPFKNF